MFEKLFGNFKNIGSKLKSGWNLGKKIFSKLGKTIRTFKSIDDPIEKSAFKQQIGDIIGDIPSKILLNPVTEFLVSKNENDYIDNWED